MKSVLSLSGGMDSSTLLLHLLDKGHEVTALSFDYGQKHKVELLKAKSLIKYLKSKGLNVTHRVIKLDGLSSLLNSSLVSGGSEVPEGHYENENMKETVVPNRNKIFSSIIQAVALSIANKFNESVYISLGIHAGDHAIYPDCRAEFRDADEHAFRVGNWDADKVGIYTPYLEDSKYEILQDGIRCCESLGISFKEVYKRTNTSYKPINIRNKWFADFKSASSVERIEAFINLGIKDPAAYADENGPVKWNDVKAQVSKVLWDAKIKD